MDSFPKQPAERLDYDVDLSEWLGGDRLISADVSVVSRYGDEAAPTLVLDELELSRKRVKLWLVGGTDQIDYKLTATVVTWRGRRKEHEIAIKVREK